MKLVLRTHAKIKDAKFDIESVSLSLIGNAMRKNRSRFVLLPKAVA